MPEMSEEQLRAMRALAENHARSKGWKVGKALGSGGSAAVFAVQTPGEELAVKVYEPSFFEEENGPAERHRLELQQQLIGHDCPSLVSIRAIEFSLGTCFMSMEYLPWVELSKCLSSVPRANIWPLVSQLVTAVRYLEDKGLVHRDIKPHNIMVSSDFASLKLIDLGVVRELVDGDDRSDGTDHGKRRPFVATAQYSSPEYLFRLTEPSAELWKGLTFYQIGAVIHDLVAQKPLFHDEVATENRYAVAMAVLRKAPEMPADTAVPIELRRLATYCLSKDLQLRLQLVRWADFEPPHGDQEAALLRRFEQIAETKRGPVAQIEEQRRLDMERSRIVEALLTALNNELKTGATSQMHPEKIAQRSQRDRGMFRLHLPNCSFVIDASIACSWREQEPPLTAAVAVRCVLAHRDKQSEWSEPELTIGTLTPPPHDIDDLVASLRKIFIAATHEALNAIDCGLAIEANAVVDLRVQ
ncbi:protein kinase [Ralstonia solanacearum]|nr:protein kinase [Ralstonia solanacearum]QKM31281.1 protein kinase [Ralstonia solanacearum]QKM36261.1 protein kinase [Ralstonia solanacearum]